MTEMYEPRDTGHSYRSQMWANRVLGLVSVGLLMAVIAQASVIYALFPLKQIEPMLLIGGSRDDQVWRVEPFHVGTRGWDLIAEKLVQDYVLKRESIDLQTEVARWQQVAWMSAEPVFAEFRKVMGRENPNSPFERAKKERLTRQVTVRVVSQLNPAQFQVAFERVDFRDGERIDRKELVATLTVEFLEQNVRREDRYMNPTGLTVIAYGLAEKSS